MIVVLNLATDHVLTSFMSMIPIVVRVKCLEKKEKIEDSIKWKLRMWKKVRDGEIGWWRRGRMVFIYAMRKESEKRTLWFHFHLCWRWRNNQLLVKLRCWICSWKRWQRGGLGPSCDGLGESKSERESWRVRVRKSGRRNKILKTVKIILRRFYKNHLRMTTF